MVYEIIGEDVACFFVVCEDADSAGGGDLFGVGDGDVGDNAGVEVVVVVAVVVWAEEDDVETTAVVVSSILGVIDEGGGLRCEATSD